MSFGGVRKATSLELRPVVSLPSLAQTHMFLASGQFGVFIIIECRSISIATAVSQREPSADATLMLLQQNTMSHFWF